MSLLPLFNWLGHTPVGVFMQQSNYGFAGAEMIHLLSLALLGGAILVVNLRLLGFEFTSQPAAHLAGELRPYLVVSLMGSILSGILLVSAETEKCYYNFAFRLKMLLLLMAVIFYFVVQQRLLQQESSRRWLQKSAAILSLCLWLAVGLAGRAIGVV